MYHLLVVDDEEKIRQIIRKYAEFEGHTVTEAADGMEAVMLCRQNPDLYSIIIMDVMMPVMNGLEASRQIRSLSRPDGNMIPILAMTAQDAISVSSQCRQYGMDDYVLKPADPEQLTKMILKYVKTI